MALRGLLGLRAPAQQKSIGCWMHGCLQARALCTTPQLANSSESVSTGQSVGSTAVATSAPNGNPRRWTYQQCAGADGIATFMPAHQSAAARLAGLIVRLLIEEPPGAVCRLRFLHENQVASGAAQALATASATSRFYAQHISTSSDSSSSDVVVFQPQTQTVCAQSKRKLTSPGDLRLTVTDLDLFRVPREAVTAANATQAAEHISVPDDSSAINMIRTAVRSAVQEHKAVGPFVATSKPEINHLIAGLVSARQDLRQVSSGSSSSGGDKAAAADFVCTVSGVAEAQRPDDNSNSITSSSSSASSSSDSSSSSTTANHKPFLVTVYPYYW